MTLQDLTDYEAIVEDPFSSEYRGKQILSAPPPASGHVVALVLQLLDEFDISGKGSRSWNYILEAFRWANSAPPQSYYPKSTSLLFYGIGYLSNDLQVRLRDEESDRRQGLLRQDGVGRWEDQGRVVGQGDTVYRLQGVGGWSTDPSCRHQQGTFP